MVLDSVFEKEVLAELVFDNRSAMKVFKNWYGYTGIVEFWQMLEEGFEKDLRKYLEKGEGQEE